MFKGISFKFISPEPLSALRAESKLNEILLMFKGFVLTIFVGLQLSNISVSTRGKCEKVLGSSTKKT